jgi:hypothetical protein
LQILDHTGQITELNLHGGDALLLMGLILWPEKVIRERRQGRK